MLHARFWCGKNTSYEKHEKTKTLLASHKDIWYFLFWKIFDFPLNSFLHYTNPGIFTNYILDYILWHRVGGLFIILILEAYGLTTFETFRGRDLRVILFKFTVLVLRRSRQRNQQMAGYRFCSLSFQGALSYFSTTSFARRGKNGLSAKNTKQSSKSPPLSLSPGYRWGCSWRT
jgi:hypothetical protein